MLNFLCKAIPAGHPFIGRMYRLIAKVIPVACRSTEGSKPNPKFKVRLTKGAFQDLQIWLQFPQDKEFARNREVPFTYFLGQDENGPLIYADSAGKKSLGFGMIFPATKEWTCDSWPQAFFSDRKPNIQLLELYAIMLAVEIWSLHLKGKHVHLHCDNMSTVWELNKKSSCNKERMFLLRHLTYICLSFQIYMTVKHEPAAMNHLSDMLSRGKVTCFHQATRYTHKQQLTSTSSSIHPVSWKKLQQ